MPCFCRFITFFVSSHVNFIVNSVYTVRIYVKGVLVSFSPNVCLHGRRYTVPCKALFAFQYL